MKLSIIIPCFNEEKNILLILNSFKKVIIRDDVEVILVDNNSTDDTSEVLKKIIPNFPFARSIREDNKGYGYAILAGLKEARGEYIGWTHGDMQTPPDDVLKALNIIEAHGNPKNIFVKGNRKGRPIFDQIFTWGMGIFESIYLGKIIYDINAQPNIFHKSFLKKWTNPPGDFSLDLYALYLAKKYSFQTVRFFVHFPKRLHGESSWNTGFDSKWKFIKRTICFSVRLKKIVKFDENRGVVDKYFDTF